MVADTATVPRSVAAAQVAPSEVVVHDAQTPKAHDVPPVHGVPQVPQFALSVWPFVSQPFAAFASQLSQPVSQAPSMQTPAAQVSAAFARTQVLPQPPQLARSVAVTFSQPSGTTPLQSVVPA